MKVIKDSESREHFVDRHIGPGGAQIGAMLEFLGCQNLEELIEEVIPKGLIADSKLQLETKSESQFLTYAESVASQNQVFKSYIGLGYYGCHTPSVIIRNILENPAWYTAYTPYQSEISQGRLEALFNFQHMVCELTGMDVSNASLLDEGTAAAEAMALTMRVSKSKGAVTKYLVDAESFPQTIDIMKTRAHPLGIELVVVDLFTYDLTEPILGAYVQYGNGASSLRTQKEWNQLSEKIKDKGGLVTFGADLLSLCLLTPPATLGADIVVGSSQRFGVPMGYGGPHAAFLATIDKFKRQIPGRIIGLSKDQEGRPAYRMALQTREQHIRREKATSNICTAQVLLAVMAGMYAVYHGPEGLKQIARRVHGLTSKLYDGLKSMGYVFKNKAFFDSLLVEVTAIEAKELLQLGYDQKINMSGYTAGYLGISLDETTEKEDIEVLSKIFSQYKKGAEALSLSDPKLAPESSFIPTCLQRQTQFLEHDIFNSYHSETEMLRYIRRLEEKDLTLAHAMIPLGSCTMKLNAASEMIPITSSGFAKMHPFAPLSQASGYKTVVQELGHALCDITGFHAISFQPNAGSQGEYAGLLVIKELQKDRGKGDRNVCLIPKSAHGTNPASAALAGMKIVIIDCDPEGNIDISDLQQKIASNASDLAALMVTYPSTHGVFEGTIREICQMVHQAGGLVYLDGANLNALVGLVKPAELGLDVCHINLHKTFAIPHGGGGPGMGPIAVTKELEPYLPRHVLIPEAGGVSGGVSSAPWGSAAILPISWAYCLMLGGEGLKRSSQMAILNANYLAKKLATHYEILYKGHGGWVAHECILDLRPLTKATGITVDDVAKRLIDYGFHAPTMSWPVAGTLMIEPTESESLQELDRFCEALISIHQEALEVQQGDYSKTDNVLINAPHCLQHMISDSWEHAYSREKASYPLKWVHEHKFWVPIGRVDNAFGDRGLVARR